MIQVTGLTKVFKIQHRRPGLHGTLQDLFALRESEKIALENKFPWVYFKKEKFPLLMLGIILLIRITLQIVNPKFIQEFIDGSGFHSRL